MDRVPSVIITSNRNELKSYQGNVVYLNDGDNFELRFFNPLQEKIGVDINFNGLRKGTGLLVINPGQDVILDRFLDEQRKMVFETYVVDGNNSDAVKAIEQNGVINFQFFKEKKWNQDVYFSSFNTRNSNSRIYKSKSKGINPGQDIWFPSSSGPAPSIQTLGASAFDGRSFADGIDAEPMLESALETGRIEKGEVSDQELKVVDLNFETHPFHTVSYKMMPFSAKTREVTEIRQYCDECGYRLRKSTWKYCPKCGNHLE
jgi:hypothetical protein